MFDCLSHTLSYTSKWLEGPARLPGVSSLRVLQPARTGAGEPGGDTCSQKTQKAMTTGGSTAACELRHVRAERRPSRTAVLKGDAETQLQHDREALSLH